jgi:Bacterial regulatory helix-turn-helix protein, lysR family
MTTILEKTTGLVAFVRTIESGSFSAASRLVGSSQSAISKSVAALERRLGVKLIQRSTRRLRPFGVRLRSGLRREFSRPTVRFPKPGRSPLPASRVKLRDLCSGAGARLKE